MAWLYWNDYLGLDPAAAADTARWAIKTLASVTHPPQPATGPVTPHAAGPWPRAGSGPVAATVVGGAQGRAAFHDLARYG